MLEFMKLNIDGTIFANQQNTRFDISFSNDKGVMIMTANKKENELNDPIDIELLTILRRL